MAIPDDWDYEFISKIKFGPFSFGKKYLPLGWIKEGTSTAQMLCPFCGYGKGYNRAILMIPGIQSKTIERCQTCGTEFIGLK